MLEIIGHGYDEERQFYIVHLSEVTADFLSTLSIHNQHLVYCKVLNVKSKIQFEDILNGSIADKIEALNQVRLIVQKRTNEK